MRKLALDEIAGVYYALRWEEVRKTLIETLKDCGWQDKVSKVTKYPTYDGNHHVTVYDSNGVEIDAYDASDDDWWKTNEAQYLSWIGDALFNADSQHEDGWVFDFTQPYVPSKYVALYVEEEEGK